MTLPRCPSCGRRLVLRFQVDLHGQVHEMTDPCLACPDGRRVAGICRDCSKSVTGRLGVALRCDPCRKTEARRASQRYRERHPEKARRIQEETNRRRREDPLTRHRRRLREREYRARPEVRARRQAQRQRRHLADPEKMNHHRRLYRQRHPERVKEQQRKANAKRHEQKLEHMHRYCTKYVGPGRLPVCECGAEIPFNGRGRPHKRCPDCAPETWRRNQSDRKVA